MYNIQFIPMIQKIQGFQRFSHIPNIAILPLPPPGHTQFFYTFQDRKQPGTISFQYIFARQKNIIVIEILLVQNLRKSMGIFRLKLH